MNPLQSRAFLIPFDQIKPEHVEPAIHPTLASAEAELQALIDLPGERSYANTVQALDDLLEPCAMCFGAALQAHLGRIVYGAANYREGAVGSVIGLHRAPWKREVAVRGGVLAPEAAELLGTFFAARR